MTEGIVRDATDRERAVAKAAPPMLDIHQKPTGWKQVAYPNNDGVLLISADGRLAVAFPSADPRSGTAALRAATKAQLFAIEHNCTMAADTPQRDLVITPLFSDERQSPANKEHDESAKPAIEVGSYVRSYDFQHSKECYVEGVVKDIALRPEGSCETYRIEVGRRVWEGKQVPVDNNEREVYPPVNGVPMMRGGVTNFVELATPPAPKAKPSAGMSL